MSETTLKEQACEILGRILELLGVQSNIKVDDSAEGVKLSLDSTEAGRLIGRKGQTLESLELILNRILKKNESSEERLPWVSIVVDGYSVEAPRHENEHHGRLPHDEMQRLQALAKDIAKEVKQLKTPRIIGPYSPSERRIIHLTLENDPDVETVSDPVADQDRGKKITVKLREG